MDDDDEYQTVGNGNLDRLKDIQTKHNLLSWRSRSQLISIVGAENNLVQLNVSARLTVWGDLVEVGF